MARNVLPAAADDDRGSLYERDYYTWALAQARALKERRAERLDWEKLAEEVEDLGRSERRELQNRLEVLLTHLLKWQFQPRRRSRSWSATIAVQRVRIRQYLEQNPGLKPALPTLLPQAYETARVDVITRLSGSGEPQPPESCPWTFDQTINPGFVPD